MFDRLRTLMRHYRYGPAVIVVSGLPRSGTSMLMTMLDAGGVPVMTDHVREADEDNPKGYYEYERAKNLENEPDKSWVRAARGKALKVISPHLSQLPDGNFYLVILSRRDPREVIASQNVMLERRGEPNPLADDKALSLYEKHFIKVRALVERKSNFEMLEVDYRETLTDPAACAMRINDFLGGWLDVGKMIGVVDPKLYRSRKEELGKFD